MSILIVDDEQDIRELVGDILRDEGYNVRLAANSDECLAAINVEAPTLMILDIWLKDSRMDGIDILKTVKRDNPDVPVVIISQIAFGARALTSFIRGTLTSAGKVMS